MRTDQKLFCLKCLLTIFLVILWIVGSAVFGVLIWLRFDYWTNEYLEINKDLERYTILLYVSMADGALILVFSILGLIGGLRSVKWALVGYLTAICLSFGLTVSGSVYGFVYREELRNTIGKDDMVKNIIQQKYNGEPQNPITKAVDIMQSELGCCGGDSLSDYEVSNWYQGDQIVREDMTPASCCKDYQRYRDDSRLCPIWELNQVGKDKDYNPNVYRQGCKTELVRFFERYILIVVGVAIAIGVIQLICIIVVSVLIHVLNNLYVPQPDDIVYDMARNQEKSPYPSRGDYRDYYK